MLLVVFPTESKKVLDRENLYFQMDFLEEKEQMKKREQERIRQDEEYYRHYILPQMMDEYFYQN